MKTLGLLAFVVLALAALTPEARAATTPTPALKTLAVTGPTNLPPKQSEVQRLTVEAEGGTFRIGAKAGEGKLTPVARIGIVSATQGSDVATVGTGGEALEVGARVVAGGFPFQAETFVVSCSPDCTTPGSTVTMSGPAIETVTEEGIVIQAKEATVEEGSFPVGSEIRSGGFFFAGTEVTAVSGSLVSLSKPPAEPCFFCEGVQTSIYEKTSPLPFDAPASAVQAAIQADPVFGAGSVSVSGGPGGTAENPYYLEFGGKFVDQDVQEVLPDSGGLVGEHKLISVFTKIPGGNGTGEIAVLPANVGALPTSGTITAKVGPLPAGIVTSGKGTGVEWKCPGGAGESTITCTSIEPLRPLHSTPDSLVIPIEVQSPQLIETTVPVELSGGGSKRSSYDMPIDVSKSPASFGISAAWAGSFEADGTPSTQAGAHPFDSAAYFMVNSDRIGNGELAPAGDSKNIVVDLPPGFVGNPGRPAVSAEPRARP